MEDLIIRRLRRNEKLSSKSFIHEPLAVFVALMVFVRVIVLVRLHSNRSLTMSVFLRWLELESVRLGVSSLRSIHPLLALFCHHYASRCGPGSAIADSWRGSIFKMTTLRTWTMQVQHSAAGVFLIFICISMVLDASLLPFLPHASRSFTTWNTLLSPFLSTLHLSVCCLLDPSPYSRAEGQLSVSFVVYRCSAFGRTLGHCSWLQLFHH